MLILRLAWDALESRCPYSKALCHTFYHNHYWSYSIHLSHGWVNGCCTCLAEASFSKFGLRVGWSKFLEVGRSVSWLVILLGNPDEVLDGDKTVMGVLEWIMQGSLLLGPFSRMSRGVPNNKELKQSLDAFDKLFAKSSSLVKSDVLADVSFQIVGHASPTCVLTIKSNTKVTALKTWTWWFQTVLSCHSSLFILIQPWGWVRKRPLCSWLDSLHEVGMLTIDDMDSMARWKGVENVKAIFVKEMMMEMLEDIRKGLTCCSLCFDDYKTISIYSLIHEHYACDNIEDMF